MRAKCGGMCGSGGRNIRMGAGPFASSLRLNFEAYDLEAGKETTKE